MNKEDTTQIINGLLSHDAYKESFMELEEDKLKKLCNQNLFTRLCAKSEDLELIMFVQKYISFNRDTLKTAFIRACKKNRSYKIINYLVDIGAEFLKTRILGNLLEYKDNYFHIRTLKVLDHLFEKGLKLDSIYEGEWGFTYYLIKDLAFNYSDDKMEILRYLVKKDSIKILEDVFMMNDDIEYRPERSHYVFELLYLSNNKKEFLEFLSENNYDKTLKNDKGHTLYKQLIIDSFGSYELAEKFRV